MRLLATIMVALSSSLISGAAMAQNQGCTAGANCPVPEPGSLALLGLGIAAAIAVSRWKK
jgi:hypothetical protein